MCWNNNSFVPRLSSPPHHDHQAGTELMGQIDRAFVTIHTYDGQGSNCMKRGSHRHGLGTASTWYRVRWTVRRLLARCGIKEGDDNPTSVLSFCRVQLGTENPSICIPIYLHAPYDTVHVTVYLNVITINASDPSRKCQTIPFTQPPSSIETRLFPFTLPHSSMNSSIFPSRYHDP